MVYVLHRIRLKAISQALLHSIFSACKIKSINTPLNVFPERYQNIAEAVIPDPVYDVKAGNE